MLLRDFVNIQNSSGYETLQSLGLETIANDSLRRDIINLYAYHYDALRKVEEELEATAFFTLFYDRFNALLAPHLNFTDSGMPISINLPLDLPADARQQLLLDLYHLQLNRRYLTFLYKNAKDQIAQLRQAIATELK